MKPSGGRDTLAEQGGSPGHVVTVALSHWKARTWASPLASAESPEDVAELALGSVLPALSLFFGIGSFLFSEFWAVPALERGGCLYFGLARLAECKWVYLAVLIGKRPGNLCSDSPGPPSWQGGASGAGGAPGREPWG